jgi:predicted Zn-dependent peptidase
MHGVYVATAPESAGAALDAIRTELRGVVESGLPADEIAMGRQQLKGQVTLSLESVSSRMYRAASVELYGEPYRTLDDILALIDGISVDDVAAVAREFFDPDQMTVLSLGPKALV